MFIWVIYGPIELLAPPTFEIPLFFQNSYTPSPSAQTTLQAVDIKPIASGMAHTLPDDDGKSSSVAGVYAVHWGFDGVVLVVFNRSIHPLCSQNMVCEIRHLW